MFSKVEWLIVAGSLAVWGIAVAGGYLFLPDDVFFYLRIADEITTGHGSTFNEIVPTNGYHPLWMIACVLMRMFTADRQRLAQEMLVTCALLYVVGAALLIRLLDRAGVKQRWPALLLFSYFLANNPAGSELHLSLVLLLLFLERSLVLAEAPPSASSGPLMLGAIAGLAMLARLDNVFLVGSIVALTVLSRRDPKAMLRTASLLALPAVLIVAPYLAWNYVTFGGVVPVSGAVKATFAVPEVAKLGAQGGVLAIAALALPFVAPPHGKTPRSWLTAFAAASFAHALYTVLRSSAAWTWYYASELLGTSLVVAFVADRLAAASGVVGVRRLLGRALPPALVVATVGVAAKHRVEQWHKAIQGAAWYVDAARHIDAVVPPGIAVATTVSPGGIAYFSHRPIFALDGLTLDRAYHYDAAREGLLPYLRGHHIGYLFTVSPESAEAASFAALTRKYGQVEDTAYKLATNGRSVSTLTVYSGLLGVPVGDIDLTRLTDRSRDFCQRDVTLFRLE